MIGGNRAQRESAAARELSRLRSHNKQLEEEARKLKLRAKRQAPIPKKALAVAQPFQIVDPRSKPKSGTKVLQALTPPITVARQMAAAVVAALREMTIETRAMVKALAAQPGAAAAMDAMPNDAQHNLAALKAKWKAKFSNLAEHWSRKMISEVTAQSTAQLSLNLHDIADRIAIQSSMSTPRMRAIVESATQSSVGLITRIPAQYLDGVQVQVMSAITTGSGLAQLVPYLTKRYKGDARHAQLTALDQVRKASENVNSARMQSLGGEEYVWIHTGGERYPRKLHQSYNGKTFRLDTPPIIDERTGVRGSTGDAIGCRCRKRFIVDFTKMREVA